MKKIGLVIVIISLSCITAMADVAFNYGIGYTMEKHQIKSADNKGEKYSLPYGLGAHLGFGWNFSKTGTAILGFELAGTISFNFKDNYHYQNERNEYVVYDPDKYDRNSKHSSEEYKSKKYSSSYYYNNNNSSSNNHYTDDEIQVNISSTNQFRVFLAFAPFGGNFVLVPFGGVGLDNLASVAITERGKITSYFGGFDSYDNYHVGYTDFIVLGGLRVEFGSLYLEFMASENKRNLPLRRLALTIGLTSRE